MNTKLLMTVTSITLALAGIASLFTPDVVLSSLNVTVTGGSSVMAQLMGALYFAFALIDWTAKDSAIGGIYARPVSLGNFSHFFAGALLLIKAQLSQDFNLPVFLVSVVYAAFAVLFYWLVFRATGVRAGE